MLLTKRVVTTIGTGIMLFGISSSNAAETNIAQKMLEVFDSMCFLAAPEFQGIETTIAGFGGKELPRKLALTDPVIAEHNGRAFTVPYAGGLFLLGITEIGTCAVVVQDRIANRLRESILKNYPVRKTLEAPSGVQTAEYFISKKENPYVIGIIGSKPGTTTAVTILQYAPPELTSQFTQR